MRPQGNFFKTVDRSLCLGMMAGPSTELAITQGAQLAAQCLPCDADPELLPQPLAEIDQPPTHDTVDSRDRTTLDDGYQCLPMHTGQSSLRSRCLAFDQAIRSHRVEPQHPVSNDLQADIANARRLAAAAAVTNRRQSQQAACLLSIQRASRQIVTRSFATAVPRGGTITTAAGCRLAIAS